MDGRCYIICAGSHEPEPVSRRPGDIVIAADAGIESAGLYGLEPDLAVGDFDSVRELPRGAELVRHDPHKAYTDTLLAVEEGLKRGYEEFVFYGALGGERLDHAIANTELLAYLADLGKRGFIFLGDTCVTAFKNGELVFPAGLKGYLSVFAASGAAYGVTETGLMYGLVDSTVCSYSPFPQWVSNEFVGTEATVSVKSGILTVVWYDRSALPLLRRSDSGY
ncbi:MAG: thiamine diphosphokinase [Clostridia bacterium]|nr:thiamine diphosphokinase [Clostridia bacterium]